MRKEEKERKGKSWGKKNEKEEERDWEWKRKKEIENEKEWKSNKEIEKEKEWLRKKVTNRMKARKWERDCDGKEGDGQSVSWMTSKYISFLAMSQNKVKT